MEWHRRVMVGLAPSSRLVNSLATPGEHGFNRVSVLSDRSAATVDVDSGELCGQCSWMNENVIDHAWTPGTVKPFLCLITETSLVIYPLGLRKRLMFSPRKLSVGSLLVLPSETEGQREFEDELRCYLIGIASANGVHTWRFSVSSHSSELECLQHIHRRFPMACVEVNSSNSRLLAAAAIDGHLGIWKASTSGQLAFQWSGLVEGTRVTCMRFARSNSTNLERLALACWDGSVSVFEQVLEQDETTRWVTIHSLSLGTSKRCSPCFPPVLIAWIVSADFLVISGRPSPETILLIAIGQRNCLLGFKTIRMSADSPVRGMALTEIDGNARILIYSRDKQLLICPLPSKILPNQQQPCDLVKQNPPFMTKVEAEYLFDSQTKGNHVYACWRENVLFVGSAACDWRSCIFPRKIFHASFFGPCDRFIGVLTSATEGKSVAYILRNSSAFRMLKFIDRQEFSLHSPTVHFSIDGEEITIFSRC